MPRKRSIWCCLPSKRSSQTLSLEKEEPCSQQQQHDKEARKRGVFSDDDMDQLIPTTADHKGNIKRFLKQRMWWIMGGTACILTIVVVTAACRSKAWLPAPPTSAPPMLAPVVPAPGPAQGAAKGSSNDGVRKCPIHATLEMPTIIGPQEYVEQPGAQIPSCGELRLYVVGSSNVLWMTWVDQLHLYLASLGYYLPIVNTTTPAALHPWIVQTCDDTRYFKDLQTARIGRIGWHSWDFAFSSLDGCDANRFRTIGSHRVSCLAGGGKHPCMQSPPNMGLIDLAEDASRSDITIVSTWFNDKNVNANAMKNCVNFETMSYSRIIREITVPCLLRTVDAIHARNPRVWILILAKYPVQAGAGVDKQSLGWIGDLNAAVQAVFEDKPRVLFVNYSLPPDVMTYQQGRNWGHPNCRGSRIMAHAVIQRLFEAKVIQRGLCPAPHEGQDTLQSCDRRSLAACHGSALCWVDPQAGLCKFYGPGSKTFQQMAS